jgi:hypothetical protein
MKMTSNTAKNIMIISLLIAIVFLVLQNMLLRGGM